MDALVTLCTANTFTIETAHRRLATLQRVLEAIFFTNESMAETPALRLVTLLNSEADPDDLTSMLAWGTTWLGSISGDTMRERIDAVRAQVDALPRLVLYVPTLLDAEGLDKIGSWLRTSFPETYLLDIEVDPQVIGGCAFIKNGQYVDYSFSARLRSQSNLIPEVIASYVS